MEVWIRVDRTLAFGEGAWYEVVVVVIVVDVVEVSEKRRLGRRGTRIGSWDSWFIAQLNRLNI
jgi:hypothetical protein